MRIGALDRKILRDAWHIRGQIVACALVVAGGINSFVSLSAVNRTLAASQAAFYEEYRFADVFAGAVRAPDPVAAALAAIPGVAALETRVAVRVNRELGTITAVITHNASIAAMGDRVIRMSSGRILEIAANASRMPASELVW